MILYPAIDLKDGRCVRLKAGRMDEATVFNEDPAAQAAAFQAAGFAWLHVVDLDGAFAGAARNGAAVRAILEATGAKVQLGGGVRDMAAVEGWLAAGVARVVIGTAAVRDPAFAAEACARFPGQVAIGVDARDGQVALSGWAEQTALPALEVVQRAEEIGAAAVIFTDIARDGLKTGVNVASTGALADAVSIPVIASGGIAGLADLEALKGWNGARAIAGAVVGRALYEGDIDPAAALALAGAA